MSVIVTMAGAGSRFQQAGYRVPKYMIEARGQTLFDWSIQSLQAFHEQHFVFACLQEHDADWIRARAHRAGLRRVDIMPRAALSLGQAQTAIDVIAAVDPHEPVWIYNIDTYIERGLHPNDLQGHQGCLHVFESQSPAMSYVRFGVQDRVCEIAEKVVISSWATVGMYGFETAQLFAQLYQTSYGQPQAPQASEQYIAPIYQSLLRQGGRVCAPRLASSAVHILGTPQEVLLFDPDVHP